MHPLGRQHLKHSQDDHPDSEELTCKSGKPGGFPGLPRPPPVQAVQDPPAVQRGSRDQIECPQPKIRQSQGSSERGKLQAHSCRAGPAEGAETEGQGEAYSRAGDGNGEFIACSIWIASDLGKSTQCEECDRPDGETDLPRDQAVTQLMSRNGYGEKCRDSQTQCPGVRRRKAGIGRRKVTATEGPENKAEHREP